MASILAAQNGNFNATSTWIGGVVPVTGDTAYANNRTVTITANVACDKISTRGDNGATAGGGFTVAAGSTGLTVAAAIEAGTTTCLTSNLITGQALNITGNVTGGSGSSAVGVINNSSGNATITGNVTGGSGGSANGVNNLSSGAVTIVGNVTGGSVSNSNGTINNSTGTLTIVGNVTGGSAGTANGANNNSTGTLTIVGNVTGGSASTANGAANVSAGILAITGIVYASALSTGARNDSSGILRVTRAVGNGFGLGGAGTSNVPAVQSGSSNSLTYILELEFGSLGNTPVSGPILLTDVTSNVANFYKEGGGRKTLVDPVATAGVLPAATDVRSGTVYASGNLTGTCAVPAASSVAAGVPVDATTGTAVLTQASVRAAVGLASANLDTQLAGKPTAAQVRSEMDSNSTKLANLDATISSRLAPGGTLARVTLTDTATTLTNAPTVPSAAAIASSVWGSAVADYTTNGTFGKGVLISSSSQREVAITGSHHVAADIHELQPAVISAADFSPGAFDGVRTSVGLASANLDTQLDALPTAAEIATAVWSAATRTLSSVSAIVSGVWGAASRTVTGGTVDTLTNSPDVPTEAEIAAAVRTELATELGRLDAAVSTRLAPSDTLARVTLADTTTTLTNAQSVTIDAEEIATAVREELSPELARVVNTATTQEVAEIIDGALLS